MILDKASFIAAVMLLLMPAAAMAAADEPHEPRPRISSTEAALSVNEPMYFVAGGDGEVKSRFQISFKYRVFDEEGWLLNRAGWLRWFHFAYTQTSLWNLSADSAPFEDSSYRPSFFWDIFTRQGGYLPAFVRTGYEHESNGRGGEASRRIDTLFVWPFWGGEWMGRDWAIGPKFYAYVSKGSYNEDIDEYRGYVDLMVLYGNEDSWLVSTTIRMGGRGMLQLDASYPIRKRVFSRTGGYIYVQVFQGYGESLLTYDRRQDALIRAGFAIVR